MDRSKDSPTVGTHPISRYTSKLLIPLFAVLVNVLQAHVSLKRIDEFLNEQETAKYSTIHKPTGSSDPVVGMVDGNFTWSDEQTALDDPSVFRIKDLNLNFPVGKLSIILGPGESHFSLS